MARSSERPFDSSRGDSRLREFLRRAGPILASERGWNERSRLKLKSLAEDLKLPKRLFDAAIQRLQEGQLDWDKQLSLYEKKYTHYLRKQLGSTKDKVLTAAHEKKAVRIARRQFQIPRQRARQLLRQVADELGMSRVSQADAINHLENLIVETIGISTHVPDDTRTRLFAEGQNWGVDQSRIESMIQSTIEDNRKSVGSGSSFWIRATAGVISTLLMVVVAYFAYTIATSGDRMIALPHLDNPELEPATPSTPPEANFSAPQWWSEETQATFDRLSNPPANTQIPIYSLIASRPSIRVDGYAELVQLAIRSGEPNEFEFGRLIASLFDDEQPALSQQIAQLIGRAIQLGADQVPKNEDAYRQAYVANRILSQCFGSTSNVDKRSMLCQQSLRSTGVSLEQPADKYVELSEIAIAEKQWRQLRALSYSNPQSAAKMVDSLRQSIPKHLREQFDEQEFATLMTILRSDSSAWEQLRQPLIRVIAGATEDQVYEMFGQASTTTNTELADWLAKQLAAVLGIDTENMQPAKIRKELKTKLEIQPDRSTDLTSRWQRLSRRLAPAQLRLASVVEKNSGQIPQIDPQKIADVAFFATLSLVLKQAELQNDRTLWKQFDEMVTQRPRDLSIPPVRRDQPSNLPVYGRIKRRPLPSDLNAHRDALDKLKVYKDTSPQTRAIALQRLAESADRFADLSPEQATGVARYLLLADETPDVIAIDKFSNRFFHWANLAVAIADEIQANEVSVTQAVNIASQVCGIEFTEAIDSLSKESIQIAILERVAAGLQHTAEVQGEDTSYRWNALEKYLFDLYRIRCQAVGISAAAISGSSRANELLELLVLNYHPSSGDEALRQQTRTNRFVAANDIEHLILNNQLLIEIVEQSALKTPLQTEAMEILVDYHQSNSQASTATQQLMINEIALLKLWMALSK